jgi:MOSC domain-containing protein YiiM
VAPGKEWREVDVDSDAHGMELLTPAELEAGIDAVRAAPADCGRLVLIVRRPAAGERETIEEGQLDTEVGLVGDTWRERPSSSTRDASPHPEKQITVMNARFASLIARHDKGRDDRRPLAGDQLYVDLDISRSNLPPGTRLAIGPAVIEVTELPHTGCAKFTERFGIDAFRVVNSPLGLELRLRGLNARVVTPGTVRVGDEVRIAREADAEDHYERPVDRFRRGAAGSVIAAGLLGLRDAIEGRPEREEVTIVSEAPSQPHDESLDIRLDPDHPERSIVIVRRPPPTEETEP